MLPVGAYVTLEHEYILILRKGGLRRFDSSGCRRNRSQSALFWEERNRWYSDVWDFRGVRQVLDGNDMRDRSAAFPFELAYRLVNMYSVRGDTVLDPFLGTGTTLVAAVAACRNSIGLEIEQSFQRAIDSRIQSLARDVNGYIAERLRAHERFIDERKDIQFKHQNNRYGFPVMTRQEKELFIPLVNQVDLQSAGRLCVTYAD
jgi:hypothetical protein